MSARAAGVLLVVTLGSLQGQTPPAVSRGPYLQMGTPTSVVVHWRANPVQTGRVWWGTSPTSLVNHMDTDPQGLFGVELRVQITGLQPATRYYYAVGLTDGTVLAGGGTDHSFVTPPPVGERAPFRAWVLGDSGTGHWKAENVRDSFHGWSLDREPDLWLMLGDNAYPSGLDSEYQAKVFDIYPTTLRRAVLWPAFGNHDAYRAIASTQFGTYFEVFDLPSMGEAGGMASGTEAYYSFDHGNVHFVCLDSEGSDRSATGPMAMWLQADLQSTTQDWIVAFWHHPPYSKGSQNSDARPKLIEMRQNIVPILESHGVDLVLCGHSHNYERSMLIDGHYGHSSTFDPATMARDPGDGSITGSGAYRKATIGAGPNEGTVYVVNGASGLLTSGAPLNHPVMVTSLLEMGSLVIDVNGLQMDLTYLNRVGAVRDRATLTKGGVTPIRTCGRPIEGGTAWKYEDTGTDLGTIWRDPLYDDTAWASGIPVLGYGETYVTTPISFGPNPSSVHPTAYFRRDFTFDVDAAHVSRLRLSVRYDDGFVAYLNGQEIARRNLPAGLVSYSTLALGDREGTIFESIDVTASLPLLQQGANVLAVEVHQAGANSDDLVFDALLSWEGAVVPIDPACAAGVVGDILTVNGSSGGIGRSIEVIAGLDISAALGVPSSLGVMADFVLLGRIGAPSTMVPVPLLGGGSLCFSPLIGMPGTSTFTLASSLPSVGAPSLSPPAPWAASYVGGIPVPGLEVVVQPVLAPVGSASWQAGNAIRLISVP